MLKKQDVPILEFDHTKTATIEARKIVKPINIPQHCVLSFFNEQINKLHQEGAAKKVAKLKSEMGAHLVFTLDTELGQVALCHPGVGAPLAAALLEELIALGCRKFVVCGGAGVLAKDVAMGELLVVTSAVRDEGTSYHYLPPDREVRATQQAVRAIESTLSEKKIDYRLAKTWTTDAIYRETRDRVALRKSEGCLAVEMEAAALFAVAQFRQVALGQILYSGDDLSGDKWESRGWSKQAELRRKLIFLAAEACLAIALTAGCYLCRAR